jgi:hypothetical protein
MSTMTSEREAFEKWMHDVMLYPPTDLVFQDARNCYADYATHLAWQAWQAHLAQPAQAVDVGAILELACQFKNDEFGVDEFQEKLTLALSGERETTPAKPERCPAHVVHPKSLAPGPHNPPLWCCLPEGHDGQHRHDGGGMYPSIPFRETDEVSMAPATAPDKEVKVCNRDCDCVGPCKMGIE